MWQVTFGWVKGGLSPVSTGAQGDTVLCRLFADTLVGGSTAYLAQQPILKHR
jgi:hypothetical protein